MVGVALRCNLNGMKAILVSVNGHIKAVILKDLRLTGSTMTGIIVPKIAIGSIAKQTYEILEPVRVLEAALKAYFLWQMVVTL